MEQERGLCSSVGSIFHFTIGTFPFRSVTIPAYLHNNTWTQLAISVEGGRTIKTFINCSWVTTQIIDGHSFSVAPQPDLVVGYMMQVGLFIIIKSQKKEEKFFRLY